MSQPNRFARAIEATTALGAVGSTTPSPAVEVAPVVPVPRELLDDLSSPTPSGPVVPDPAWATENLSMHARGLHGLACPCPWGGDVEGHGVDFEELAGAYREAIIADAIDAGEVADVPVDAPVEAKVKAGGWATLAATVGVALLTLLLDRLDVLPSMLGGEYPWTGPLVLALGVVLPPLIGFLRAYAAPHSPRPARTSGASS